MVLEMRSGDEFIREVIKLAETAEDIVRGFDTREEALQYIAGTIGTLRVLSLNLLEPDVYGELIKYLDKREDELRDIAKKLPECLEFYLNGKIERF